MIAPMQHLKTVVKESVIQAVVDDEVLLLDMDSGQYFGLQGVAARIWELLENGAAQTAIREQLLIEYEVAPAQLDHDITTFLRTLREKGLVRDVPA